MGSGESPAGGRRRRWQPEPLLQALEKTTAGVCPQGSGKGSQLWAARLPDVAVHRKSSDVVVPGALDATVWLPYWQGASERLFGVADRADLGCALGRGVRSVPIDNPD